MESDAMHRAMVSSRTRNVLTLALGVLLCWLSPRPALAQANAVNAINVGQRVELAGSWAPIPHEWVSNDTVPVDYTALPLNEAGRTRALSYSESQLGMIERQCEGWSASYILTGPFGLKISSEFEPVKGNLVSYTIAAWEDKLPMVIWMDGRPHPSKFAEHTRSGFTTGRWEGNTLVTYTTHMKEGFLRKNGAPLSDMATMTIRFIRHGNMLLLVGVIEDAVYLAEPMVWTRNFEMASTELAAIPAPCIAIFEGTSLTSDVPHWLWGKKPFIDELTKQYGIPQDAVLGFPETLYPEYRQKMKTAGR
jgi:hypothetical protein